MGSMFGAVNTNAEVKDLAPEADDAEQLAAMVDFDPQDKFAAEESPDFELGQMQKKVAAERTGEMHAGVAAGEGGSEWKQKCPALGLRWREIPVEHKVNAWECLRDWVQWFVLTYEVSLSKLPGCWFAHPAAVEELWIAFNAEIKAWEEGLPSSMPMTAWSTYVPGLLARLSEIQSMRNCGAKEGHQGVKEYEKHHHPLQRKVDEQLWAEYALGDVKSRELEPGMWRVLVEGNSGQESESVEVSVDALDRGSETGLGAVYVQRAGSGAVQVRAHGFGTDAAVVRWEHLDEATGEWVSEYSGVDALPMRDTSGRDGADTELLAQIAERVREKEQEMTNLWKEEK